jgi:hypothetical protein
MEHHGSLADYDHMSAHCANSACSMGSFESVFHINVNEHRKSEILKLPGIPCTQILLSRRNDYSREGKLPLRRKHLPATFQDQLPPKGGRVMPLQHLPTFHRTNGLHGPEN